MPLFLHNLKPARGAQRKRKTIGRGGKRGTYSGRGMKGQGSRSGGRSGLNRRGLRQLIERTHKLPGFKSYYKKPAVVSLNELAKRFKDHQVVTPLKLAGLGVISNAKNGVKILSGAPLKIKLTIKNCSVSAPAKQLIESAGGQVIEKKVTHAPVDSQAE